MKKTLIDRFLYYVRQDTQSDTQTLLTPSTPGQLVFLKELKLELEGIGLKEVCLHKNGYLTATLPANTTRFIPTIGFIAHVDTSPDISGRKVSPRIIPSYDGKRILLDIKGQYVLSPDEFPELSQYIGQDLIVTDGQTLLGADDKAGVAAIVTAMCELVQTASFEHGKVRIAFTPDEEIGQGTKYFDVADFAAEWAYTIDGGAIGELEFENFNAAEAKVVFKGRNVHPGYAKHKMLNAIRIANQYAIMLPRWETPEHTEEYEGFYHLVGFQGGVEQTILTYLIRDHDVDRFERRKKELEHLVRKINREFPNCASIQIEDQYRNMREKIEPVMHIVDLAAEAMRQVEVTPIIKPVRGGTDGAQLSFKGLPCPNIFAGGHNFHGRYEFLPVSSLEKSKQVIKKIIELVAKQEH